MPATVLGQGGSGIKKNNEPGAAGGAVTQRLRGTAWQISLKIRWRHIVQLLFAHRSFWALSVCCRTLSAAAMALRYAFGWLLPVLLFIHPREA